MLFRSRGLDGALCKAVESSSYAAEIEALLL